jgi:hypothetical protein
VDRSNRASTYRAFFTGVLGIGRLGGRGAEPPVGLLVVFGVDFGVFAICYLTV